MQDTHIQLTKIDGKQILIPGGRIMTLEAVSEKAAETLSEAKTWIWIRGLNNAGFSNLWVKDTIGEVMQKLNAIIPTKPIYLTSVLDTSPEGLCDTYSTYLLDSSIVDNVEEITVDNNVSLTNITLNMETEHLENPTQNIRSLQVLNTLQEIMSQTSMEPSEITLPIQENAQIEIME